MRKKWIASALSAAVCASMLGTTCFAAAGGDMTNTAGSTITGDSTVKSPVYSVVVPTTVAFGIDAFEQAGQTNSQISSADLTIYNRSNVAVRVQADVTLTPATGVTLVDDASEVKEDGTDKTLFIGLEVPKAVTLNLKAVAAPTDTRATDVANYTLHASDSKLYLTSGLTADETGNGGAFNGEGAADAEAIKAQEIDKSTITYATGATGDEQYIVPLGEDKISVAFALDKADYYKVYNTSSDAAGEDKFYKAASASDGATAFRLTGAVNSRAAWAANDVQASVTYSFLGIREANYATQAEDAVEATANDNIAYVDDTAKLLMEMSGPKFTASADTFGLVTYTVGTGDDALDTITSMKWDYSGSEFEIMANVTHNAEDHTLKLVQANHDYWATLADEMDVTIVYTTVGGETKNANVTFKLK